MNFHRKFNPISGIIRGMMTEKAPNHVPSVFTKPVPQLIEERFSCRTYLPQPVEHDTCEKLEGYVNSIPVGSFGSRMRFKLVSAKENDGDELRRLGTYGFIRGATGFVIGAVEDKPYNLEDCGYMLESIVLYATDLGLGTCWLGGTFTKSSFARRMELLDGESIPAVLSMGYIANKRTIIEKVTRTSAKADRRIPWKKLFFDSDFNRPLTKEEAGEFAHVLEMVRQGPSASNRQPWRVVRGGDAWHFFLQRTPGYRERYVMKLLSIADMQRIGDQHTPAGDRYFDVGFDVVVIIRGLVNHNGRILRRDRFNARRNLRINNKKY